MLGKVLITSIIAFGLFGLYLTFRSPKELCNCGVRIPEFGGMCECGEYNGRMLTQEVVTIIDEQELRRIEEEKRKGNSYDTFL